MPLCCGMWVAQVAQVHFLWSVLMDGWQGKLLKSLNTWHAVRSMVRVMPCFHGKVWSYVVMVWFVVPESGWWSMARPISCAQGFCWHPHPTTKAGNDVLVFRFLGTLGHSQGLVLDGIPRDYFRHNCVREPDMRWLMTKWGHGQRSKGATTVDKFILWQEPFLFHSHSLQQSIFYSKRKFCEHF